MAIEQWTRIEYPPEFKLSVEELARMCAWQLRKRADGYFVRTEESYLGTTRDLLELRPVADASNAADPRAYAVLDQLTGQDDTASPESLRLVQALPEVSNPSNPHDPWVALRLLFMTVPDAEVRTLVASAFAPLMDVDPGARCWIVAIAPELSWRQATARALYAAEAAPTGWDPALDELSLFPAGMAFMRSLQLGLSAYLEPAALALAPSLSMFMTFRRGGMLAITFDHPLPGRSPAQSPELIDVFKPHGFVKGGSGGLTPALPPGSSAAALRWWVGRVNSLLAAALDPATWRRADGSLECTRQIAYLLSLERLFTSAQAVLANTRRDPFSRFVLFFDVLDVLEGLGGDWVRMVTLAKVEDVLRSVEHSIPAEAHPALLPRCRAAVEALRGVREGFLPSRRRGGLVVGRAKDAREVELNPDGAAAAFLRLARNGSHAYTDRLKDPGQAALLASHEGELPEELADLAFLHLLAFLVAPRRS